MARIRKRTLPRYLELHPVNQCFYYKNPSMPGKVNLGKNRSEALETANRINARYRVEVERKHALERMERLAEGVPFEQAITLFVDKYILDYRLKPSTATLLRQRRDRLIRCLGRTPIPALDTQILREAIQDCSPFEQSKLKTLLDRFFRFNISAGSYPSCLPNPVSSLYTDPTPPKQRRRIDLQQFKAILEVSPEWLQWMLTLAFHLALRRIDLVNLRFDDIRGDRIVSAIRKTDSSARTIESTSVDFPVHPDVRAVITKARRSSLMSGRCPFIIHRTPDRLTRRSAEALRNGVMEHSAQVLPQFATKAFSQARSTAMNQSNVFDGLAPRELPTLHEVRSLASHLYARAGYEVAAVQDLMAHTDPDMTRAYQRGHARKVLRVEMMLPFGIHDSDGDVQEPRGRYGRGDRWDARENALGIL